jgi:hypothetical protein
MHPAVMLPVIHRMYAYQGMVMGSAANLAILAHPGAVAPRDPLILLATRLSGSKCATLQAYAAKPASLLQVGSH